MNSKQAFDVIENTLAEQGFKLGRDYRIEHCDVQNFLIQFCNKRPTNEIDMRELFIGLGGSKVLKFKLLISYPRHRMTIKLRLPVTEEF